MGLVLAAAAALAVPAYGRQGEAGFPGFGERMRVALALLLQGVGGGFEVHGAERADPNAGFALRLDGGTSLSLVPLTVTALWIAALSLGLRGLRARLPPRAPGPPPGGVPTRPTAGTAGLEAAVRVALLLAGATLALELCAQPTVLGLRISSSSTSGALGSLLLGLAATAAVLHREHAACRPATGPGVQSLVRATGTALRALGVVLALGSVAAYVTLCQTDDLDRTLGVPGSGVAPQLVALSVLPNLAVAALGLGWGAPLRATAGGSSAYGSGYESESFGLAELADAAGPGAAASAVALALVSALTVGVLAVRRSRGRREQLLAAGVFFGLFLLLAAIGGAGVSAHGTASAYDTAGTGGANVTLNLPATALFGLLWLTGGLAVAPYLTRWPASTPRTPAAAPPIRLPEPLRAAQHAPPTIPAPTPPRDHPKPVAAATPTRPRNRLTLTVAALAATLLLSAAATAATVLWHAHTPESTPYLDQPATP